MNQQVSQEMKDEAMQLRASELRNRIFQLLFQVRCELECYNHVLYGVESYISDLRNLK